MGHSGGEEKNRFLIKVNMVLLKVQWKPLGKMHANHCVPQRGIRTWQLMSFRNLACPPRAPFLLILEFRFGNSFVLSSVTIPNLWMVLMFTQQLEVSLAAGEAKSRRLLSFTFPPLEAPGFARRGISATGGLDNSDHISKMQKLEHSQSFFYLCNLTWWRIAVSEGIRCVPSCFGGLGH